MNEYETQISKTNKMKMKRCDKRKIQRGNMGITTEFKTQTDSNFELIFSWLGKQLDVLVCLYSVATERPFFGMKKGIFRHPCFVSKTDATEHLKTKLPYVNSERNQGTMRRPCLSQRASRQRLFQLLFLKEKKHLSWTSKKGL